MTDQETNREDEMRSLAEQLFFDVEKHGSKFTLHRESGIPEPAHHEGLTLDEAESLLDTWKLRGLGGG